MWLWTISGVLAVKKKGEFYEMDFPAYQLKEVAVTKEMIEAIGIKPLQALRKPWWKKLEQSLKASKI